MLDLVNRTSSYSLTRTSSNLALHRRNQYHDEQYGHRRTTSCTTIIKYFDSIAFIVGCLAKIPKALMKLSLGTLFLFLISQNTLQD